MQENYILIPENHAKVEIEIIFLACVLLAKIQYHFGNKTVTFMLK